MTQQDLSAIGAARQRIERAQQDRHRAEAQREQAEQTRDAALRAIAGEFPGITSPEAAQRYLADLDAAVAAEVSRVEAALAAAGGLADGTGNL
jgi:MoxR-like ATPase